MSRRSWHDRRVTLTDLRTPAVLVDKTRALRNIDRMQAAATARGLRLRPHAKTHKSPAIAGWQIERGAIGICCAKIGEAEIFADAGVTDIRIPYPINPANADRVVALARRTHLSFIVDHPGVAAQWSAALAKAATTVDVLVKIDVGFHRCGIAPEATTAVPFIAAVAALPGLHLKGLLSHAGQAYHASSAEHLREISAAEAATLRALAAAARAAGVAIEELSAGATPTARFSMQQDGLTEYRPGNYVYFDRTQIGLGAATADDCALTVMARVVSKPASDRVSEEHATVKAARGTTSLEPGDVVRVLPNHSCVVSNLVDQAWLLDGDRVTALPVAARGRIV
jgi:D-serine deaminase-like pyridoxal phosphate-dependent protein